MSKVVIHPTIGWAVKAPSDADFPVLPPGVEAEPDLDGQLLELQACLDELVAGQQQQYKQYEADLARMSPEEKALFYSRNAGDAVYDNVIDDSWQMIKAAPAVLEKAAKAFPGFCKNSLNTLWKVAQTPSRMAYLTAQGIATGNYNPLQQEIDSIVTPLATTYEQALEYKSMLTVLFQDEDLYPMLYDFAERYWDATHPVERTRMTASAASDVLVTLILAISTAGVGAAANVAAKSGKLAKAGKLLKKITETIKRTGSRHQVPKKDLEGGAETIARTSSGAKKGGTPKVKPKPLVLNEQKIPCFKKNKKGKVDEYERQVQGQKDGLNNMTAQEYLDGRKTYADTKRASTKEFRDKYKKDLIKRYKKSELTEAEAISKATKTMKTLNALHNPDMIAGGKDIVSDMGDASVNKSIGSQWNNGTNADGLTRVEQLDKAAEKAVANGQGDFKMNANLHRCK
jgi:hypothetical protein